MGLLHTEDPVTDATVNCPQCRAIDWVVRKSRLGGQGKIVCRACGHVQGPYYEFERAVQDETVREHGRRDLERAPFPVYVPEGVDWRPESWFGGGDVLSVSVLFDEPRGAVVTEPAADALEPAEALREAISDMLATDEPPPGRSHAAHLLEMAQEDERIERQVADLAVENATLRVDGAEVPCKLMRTHDAWAAYLELGEVVVTAGAAGIPLERFGLVRHG
jgi:hypothetical protein